MKSKTCKKPSGYKFQSMPTKMAEKTVSTGRAKTKGMGRAHGNGRTQARPGY